MYVVLLYVVPTECTDHTEAYGLKLFESTEWPTLRDARIHRNECLRQTMGIILLVVLLYVVPTEYTDYTEAYGLKLFESTEWPTLRDARIHRNECLHQTMGIILLVVLLYVVPTEYTDYTEAYRLKLFESTEWPTLRDARIHRNECLLVCVLWELQAKEI